MKINVVLPPFPRAIEMSIIASCMVLRFVCSHLVEASAPNILKSHSFIPLEYREAELLEYQSDA